MPYRSPSEPKRFADRLLLLLRNRGPSDPLAFALAQAFWNRPKGNDDQDAQNLALEAIRLYAQEVEALRDVARRVLERHATPIIIMREEG